MQKIKITPLGGLEEIGKNMTVIESETAAIIIDCGLSFSEEEYLGVSLEIPDFTYLNKIKNKIKALVITHAHEDHIGAIYYLLEQFPGIRIYGTEFTICVIERKLLEREIEDTNLCVVDINEPKTFGDLKIDFIQTSHSIIGSVAVAITTPFGKIIHTGDFKIEKDNNSMSEKIDLDKFKKYGEEGVLLLMSDSTNAQKNKNLVSETTVGIELEKHISSSKKRIIISTFASNIYRVQQIIKVAEKHKRKVAISGMSMDNMLGVSLELGYTKFNKSTLITLDEIQNCCDEDLVIITTGSQGEEMSALYRIAHGIHKQITISKNDLIILSSSAIPGNEKSINSMIDMLVKKGAEVIYNKNADVHSSGHACKDELSTIINLCKPKYFMPIHGEYSHLIAHKQIALETGIKDENIIIPSIGTPLLIEEDSYTLLEKVPSGKVFVNNLGAGYIGVETLRERESLAKKGLIVINILLNKNNKTWGDNIVIKNIGFLSDEYFNIRKASIEIMIDILVSRFKGYDEEKIETELKKGFSTFCYNEFKEIPNIYCKIYKL